MKLYILRPKVESELWVPWYDKTFGFVVRASNEKKAREIAAEKSGAEGGAAWLSDRDSTCEILTSRGGSGVVIEDVHAA